MKKILQIDGGGLRGIVALSFLTQLEKKMGRRSCDIFELISGNSTGAIIGASLSIGMFAIEVLDMYVNNGPYIFKPRSQILPWNWLRPKYDRNRVIKTLDDAYNGDYLMKQCLTNLMITSINRDTGNAVFFKSWKEEWKEHSIINLVNRSYAAANYFGYYKDSDGEWLDGGNGANNCNLNYVLSQCFKHNSANINIENNESISILSLGTGGDVYHKKITHIPYIDDIINTSSIARKQSTVDQVYLTNSMNNEKFKLFRVDPVLTDRLDNVKNIPEYVKKGVELFEEFDYKGFANDNKYLI